MIFIKFVRKNIRRAPYQALAATMIMFLTFLVLSSFLILAVGFGRILQFYEGKPQAIAFFKDGTTNEDLQIIQNILTQTGKVTKFKYVSKEEALQIYRDRNKNNPMLLELVTASILPASLEISTQSPQDLSIISETIKKEPVIEEVVFPEDVVKSLTQATQLVRNGGVAIVGFLLIFSILVIVMIIGFKIRLKKDEIETMRLLGASTWFIRIPYLFEGMVYAVSGAVLGWVLSFSLLWYFEPLLKNNLGEVADTIFPVSPIFLGELLTFEIFIAIFVGGLGSFIAVRRYLHL